MFLFGPHAIQFLRDRAEASDWGRARRDALMAAAREALSSELTLAAGVGRAAILPTARRFEQRGRALIGGWMLTGEPAYRQRLSEDLGFVCALPDWNPTHLLDTCEMLSAAVLARNWLGLFLTRGQAEAIDAAILRLGLAEGLASLRRKSEWSVTDGNWNLICNAALILAATSPSGAKDEIAAEVIDRATEAMRRTLATIPASGDWFEGVTYFARAAHHVALLDIALRSQDILLDPPDLVHALFRRTDFARASFAPSGQAYNFGDTVRMGEGLAMAGHITSLTGQPLPKALAGDPLFDLMFGTDSGEDQPPPPVYLGESLASLCDGQGSGLAISAGQRNHPHGHHDLGSLIWDCGQTRVIADCGRGDYGATGYFGAKRYRHFAASVGAHNLPFAEATDMAGWSCAVTALAGGQGLVAVVISADGTVQLRREVHLTADGLRVVDSLPQSGPLLWRFYTPLAVKPEGADLLLTDKNLTIRVKANLAQGSWQILPIDAKAHGLADSPDLTLCQFACGSGETIEVDFTRLKMA